jgi:hypothetical protein
MTPRGILNPDTYAPEIDSAVLVGFPAAEHYLGFDGNPSEIYVRTTPDNQAATTTVDNLLGAQASPENPSQVTVSQPSDALTAAADRGHPHETASSGITRHQARLQKPNKRRTHNPLACHRKSCERRHPAAASTIIQP